MKVKNTGYNAISIAGVSIGAGETKEVDIQKPELAAILKNDAVLAKRVETVKDKEVKR